MIYSSPLRFRTLYIEREENLQHDLYLTVAEIST